MEAQGAIEEYNRPAVPNEKHKAAVRAWKEHLQGRQPTEVSKFMTATGDLLDEQERKLKGKLSTSQDDTPGTQSAIRPSQPVSANTRAKHFMDLECESIEATWNSAAEQS